MKPFSMSVKLKAQNTQNSRMHWAAKSSVVKAERAKVGTVWLASGGRQWVEQIPPALVVTLTRVGPRKLDSDNLAASLKGVRDAVASRLGVDDGGPLVKWEYAQETGDYEVRIDIAPPRVAIHITQEQADAMVERLKSLDVGDVVGLLPARVAP